MIITIALSTVVVSDLVSQLRTELAVRSYPIDLASIRTGLKHCVDMCDHIQSDILQEGFSGKSCDLLRDSVSKNLTTCM